jgi:predicted small metal-binding protein
MAVCTRCKGCGIELTADDEDQLVTAVQQHIADAHSGGHTPTREQVLAVIRSRAHQSH